MLAHGTKLLGKDGTALADERNELAPYQDFDRFDLRTHPPAVRPPTLLVHTDIDTAVPVGPSRDLAALAPGLGWPMHYLEVAGAEHTGAWNADPEVYERAVAGFLGAHLAPDGRSGDLARWVP